MVWEGKEKSDIELINGCMAKNSHCQELLYKRYFSFAMSVCIRYITDTQNAMEVVNDSFYKLFNTLKSYNTSKPFKPWFARILVNTAIDNLRKSKGNKNLVILSDIPEKELHNADIEINLSADDIVKLLNQLPETYRMVFNLYEIEGYSHDEISQMLGIGVSTSRANLSRAKEKLRELYLKTFYSIASDEELRRTV
jgi:RNA polymerase sigma factor (sigma-70 family)